nr:DUF637 domain-containing protein [Pectobacterium sp. PL152]
MLDNQGDIIKMLKASSNSYFLKPLVTSMVIGGALSGFDSVMGFDKVAGGAAGTNAGNAKLPLLSNGDWSKIAQRVAGQSIISSSLIWGSAAVWGAGWGFGKIVGPALGKYLTKAGILSQKGAFKYKKWTG